MFPLHPFSTPWKHQKTVTFCDVFRGVEKGCIENELVNSLRKPICFQCTLSLPPENISKPYGFLMFSRGRERVQGAETLLTWYLKFQNVLKADLIPLANILTPTLWEGLYMPVAFVVDQLVIHWGNINAVICNCGGVSRQMHGQWSLQIICTYR